MVFLASLIYMAFVALVIYAIYRVVDTWINRIISTKQEQNAALKEIAAALRKKNLKLREPKPDNFGLR